MKKNLVLLGLAIIIVALSSTATNASKIDAFQDVPKQQIETSSSTRGVAEPLGQCGGIGWTGPTVCPPGYVCTYINDHYSQCLPIGTCTHSIGQRFFSYYYQGCYYDGINCFICGKKVLYDATKICYGK